MNSNLGLAIACAGAVALSGCGFDLAPDNPDDTEESGIAVTMDAREMASVDRLQFDVETCDGEQVISEERDVSELEFDENLDLDVEGSVDFADYFASLEAGCYDVQIVPLDADGDALDQCIPATAEEIEVEAGETTEIVMVSQCGGDIQGGLDVLGVINFAPTLTVLEFDPSKVVDCESVQVCATAVDSDGDPVEFEWEQLDGPTPQSAPEVVSSTEDNGEFAECIEMTPGWTASYEFEVSAYDLMEDDDGELVRVDDLDEDFDSRSSLSFPVHAVCEDPPEDVLGEVEDDEKTEEEYADKEEEEVLGEVEDDEKTEEEYADKEEEEVLGEVEDDEKTEEEYADKEEEEVLGEVEDDEKTEEEYADKEEEEVLGEVEDDEKTEEEYADKEEEEVLGEVEDDEKTEEEYADKEEEEVLGEVEDDEKEKKEFVDVDEDVLGEFKKSDPYDDKAVEEVLGEVENCTLPVMFWRTFHADADDAGHVADWPVDEETMLGDYTWIEVVESNVSKKAGWIKLAQQYVVANLNIEVGAESTQSVDDALAEAEALLDSDGLRGSNAVRAKDLAQLLYWYNTGEIGPGICSQFEEAL